MTNDIFSLDTIAQFLEVRGYEVEQSDTAVITRVGSFPTVITVDDVDGDGDPDIRITTQLTTLGSIPESRRDAFLFKALDINTRILPFAVALLTSEDGEEGSSDDFPVVLIDSIPVGDLSEDEFQSALDSLLQAILGTRELLTIGFGDIDVPRETIQIRRSQVSRSQLQSFVDRNSFDGDLEDLIEELIFIGLLIDDGFFFGEEAVIEDPLVDELPSDEPVDEVFEVEESTEDVEPAPVTDDETTRQSSGSYDYGERSSGSYDYSDDSTRSSSGGSSGSYDSGSSDSGGGGDSGGGD